MPSSPPWSRKPPATPGKWRRSLPTIRAAASAESAPPARASSASPIATATPPMSSGCGWYPPLSIIWIDPALPDSIPSGDEEQDIGTADPWPAGPGLYPARPHRDAGDPERLPRPEPGGAVLLSKAMTPGCTVQARGMRDVQAELESLGAVALGVSIDPVARLQRFVDRDELNFPLLSDEDHAVAEQYGVWGLKQFAGRVFMGLIRTTFLIGRDRSEERRV